VNSPPPALHLIAETGSQRANGSSARRGWQASGLSPPPFRGLTLVGHPDYRGSGVEHSLMDAALSLADQWLGLQRLEVTVYDDDESAVSFYEQYGFEREALMPRFAFRAGQYSAADLLARRRVSTPAVETRALRWPKPVSKEGSWRSRSGLRGR
jgi:ribosomal protein S18 acetylase RimI-like enzyme